MIEEVFGVIDIGSNSVRLMLWQNGKTLEKSVITTRLSEGMMDNILVSEPIERTIKAVVELCNKARSASSSPFTTSTSKLHCFFIEFNKTCLFVAFLTASVAKI